jgi:hypothetical protein
VKSAWVRVLLVVGLCLLIVSGLTSILSPDRTLKDFSTFVEAGAAYNQGMNPYKLYFEFPEGSGEVEPTVDEEHSPNLNPPISLYPFSLLAKTDWEAARNWLNVVSAVTYAGVCYMLLRAYPWQRKAIVGLWLLAVAGFWYTLLLGQVYMLLLVLGASALLLIERGQGHLVAGVLIGLLVAIKPNFVVWPALMLLAGHRRPALTSLLVAALVSTVPLVIEGPTVYTQWLDAARGYPRAALALNAALFGETARLGVPALGYGVAFAILGAAGYFAWRWRLTLYEASAAGIMVTLLVGPLTWIGYTLMALPLLLSRRWGGWEVAVAATMAVPAGLNVGAGEIRLAGLLILAGLVVKDALLARRWGVVRTEEPAAPTTALAEAA